MLNDTSIVGRLRSVGASSRPADDRPGSPTRESLMLLTHPTARPRRRKRPAAPGRLEPIDRPRSPGLYGQPAESITLRPPAPGTADSGYKFDAYEAKAKSKARGRRRKKPEGRRRPPERRAESPPYPPQRRGGPAPERPAATPSLRSSYVAQLTSVEHVRDSLPLDFLIATGQHEEVLRRRLGHLLRVLDHSRLSAMRPVFGYWKEGVRLEQSREFVEKTVAAAKKEGCGRIFALLEAKCLRAAHKRFHRWQRFLRLSRLAEWRRLRAAMARRIQKWSRAILLKARGRRFLDRLRKRRMRADAAARGINRAEHLHQFAAARLRRSRKLADKDHRAAREIQQMWRVYWAKKELARRIYEAQAAKEASAGVVLAKFWMFLKADQTKSNRMASRLSMWREKKMAGKQTKAQRKAAAKAGADKKAEMMRQLEARKKRAAQLKAAGQGETDASQGRALAKGAAAGLRGTARGRSLEGGADDELADAMASAGGDLARAAEQAEAEEIRRLEEMLAHEEAMAKLREDVEEEVEEEETVEETVEEVVVEEKRPETPQRPPTPVVKEPPTEEEAVVAVQKRIRSWGLRNLLAMKRKARQAYWDAFWKRIARLKEVIAAAVIIRSRRVVLLQRDAKLAEGVVAGAVAHLTELYLWSLLDEAERQERIRRRKAAEFIQKCWRKRMVRRRDWHDRTAKVIQRMFHAHVARRVMAEARAARAELLRRHAAATRLFHFWHRLNQRRALAARSRAEKLDAARAAEDAAWRAGAEAVKRFARHARLAKTLRKRVDVRLVAAAVVKKAQVRTAAAATISKNYRRHWDYVHEVLRARAAAEARAARGRYEVRFGASATLARHWFAMKWRYGQPLRIVARRRVAAHEERCVDVVAEVRERDAALIIRRAIRHRLDRDFLRLRFAAQRSRLDLERDLAQRLDAAERIQQAWLRCLEDRAEAARVDALAMREARLEELELQEDAAYVIQKCAQCYLFNRLLELRFQASRQRLDAEAEQRRRVDAARDERGEAEKAQEVAEAALTQVQLSSWKMGADEHGQNYYYNWVTGESQYDKPEGWYPASGEVWVKQTDSRNNVFYFNQDTLESAWFPPCSVCMKLEAKKICFTCDEHSEDGVFYCSDCFDTAHPDADHKHTWRGADQDKEELGPGEKHCLVCGKAKCAVTCAVCRDSYCQACFREKHSHGKLYHHPTIPFDEARRGWQEIVGRVQGEQTYYYNVTTGENRFDKPEEFMLEDELREHKNFLKFKAAGDKHAKRVEELQIEVERLQYDKDTTLYNLSKKRGAENEELEELRRLLMADQGRLQCGNQSFEALQFEAKRGPFDDSSTRVGGRRPKARVSSKKAPNRSRCGSGRLTFMQKYARVLTSPLAYLKEQRDIKRRKKKMYRKMLLLNKREREAAFHDNVFKPPEISDADKKKRVVNSKGLAVITE